MHKPTWDLEAYRAVRDHQAFSVVGFPLNASNSLFSSGLWFGNWSQFSVIFFLSSSQEIIKYAPSSCARYWAAQGTMGGRSVLLQGTLCRHSNCSGSSEPGLQREKGMWLLPGALHSTRSAPSLCHITVPLIYRLLIFKNTIKWLLVNHRSMH